jgi:hypothetical protein
VAADGRTLPAATDGLQVGFGCPGYLDRPRLPPRMACQAASSTTAPRIDPMMPLGRRANPSPLTRPYQTVPAIALQPLQDAFGRWNWSSGACTQLAAPALELAADSCWIPGNRWHGPPALGPWTTKTRVARGADRPCMNPRRTYRACAPADVRINSSSACPCLPWWPFSRSFHQALLHRTRPDSTASRPNLTCLDPTGP